MTADDACYPYLVLKHWQHPLHDSRGNGSTMLMPLKTVEETKPRPARNANPGTIAAAVTTGAMKEHLERQASLY